MSFPEHAPVYGTLAMQLDGKHIGFLPTTWVVQTEKVPMYIMGGEDIEWGPMRPCAAAGTAIGCIDVDRWQDVKLKLYRPGVSPRRPIPEDVEGRFIDIDREKAEATWVMGWKEPRNGNARD